MKKILFGLILCSFASCEITYAQDSAQLDAKATSWNSQKAIVYYNEGIEAAEKGKLKRAIRLYRKAVKQKPHFGEAYNNMGLAYRKLGAYSDAEKCYNLSLAHNPEDIITLENMGDFSHIQQDYEKAKFYYNQIIEKAPDHAAGNYGLAITNYAQEEYHHALEYAKTAVTIHEGQKSENLENLYHLVGLLY